MRMQPRWSNVQSARLSVMVGGQVPKTPELPCRSMQGSFFAYEVDHGASASVKSAVNAGFWLPALISARFSNKRTPQRLMKLANSIATTPLGWKLGVGNANVVCMERPFLHAFAFTEPDLGQLCGPQFVCSIDFHRTLADFRFVSVFAKHDFHELNYIVTLKPSDRPR
jgi:hypothetical protein